MHQYINIFLHTSAFQRLDEPWSQASSLPPPPSSCLQFLSRIGFSNPTARRFFIDISPWRYRAAAFCLTY